MRSYIIFLFLLAVKLAGKLCFRVRLEWIDKPADPWSDHRILALLNHTSLFEPVLLAAAPNRLLWQVAAHGVLPVADKTVARPIVGRFFKLVAQHVVPVTRERDGTWADVLSRVHDPKALVVILPEGRMMRRTGLDAHGNRMTVRGGIADIIENVPEGRIFLVYSEGLHHVHAPGDRFPRLFQRVRIRAELLDLPSYRAALADVGDGTSFKAAVVSDLTRRRDAHCFHGHDRRDARDSSARPDGSTPPSTGSAETNGLPPSVGTEAPRIAVEKDQTDLARVLDVGDGVPIED